MEALLSVGLWNAVGALLLALVVATIGCFCRRPAVMHALWLLVLVKLVAPPLWPIPISLPALDSSQEPARVVAVLPPQLLKPLETAVDADASPAVRVVADDAVKPATIPVEPQVELPPIPAVSIPSPPFPLQVSQWQWTWVEAAFGGWTLGVVMYWTLALVRVVRFRRALRRLTPAPESLQAKTEHLARRLGLRTTPLVYLLNAPISPMVWAFGRKARLLLPRVLWESLSDTQRDLLLSHELTHLQRRDHWVRLFELLVVGLYWWLPVAWWARRRLQEAGESCCDACVLSLFPEAAPDYASTLVDSAAFLSQNRSPSPLPVGASGIGHVPLMRRRLTMILSGKTPRGLSWVSIGLLLIAAAVLLPLWPSPVEPAVEAQQSINDQHGNAEKEFNLAVLHEQTGHPGSAHFFYEIVRRKYAGTVWAEKAEKKMAELRRNAAKLEEGQPAQAKDRGIDHVPIPIKVSASQCAACHANENWHSMLAKAELQIPAPPPAPGAPGFPGVEAVQAKTPPAQVGPKTLSEMRDEIDLLKVKLQMEKSRLQATEAELEIARLKVTIAEKTHEQKQLHLSYLQIEKQEFATRRSAHEIQSGQVQYVELQLKQAQRRYDELAGQLRPEPEQKRPPVGFDAKKLFDHLSHDFGAVKPTADIAHNFQITNHTKSRVDIESVLRSPSFKGVPQYQPANKTLKPGEKTELLLVIEPVELEAVQEFAYFVTLAFYNEDATTIASRDAVKLTLKFNNQGLAAKEKDNRTVILERTVHSLQAELEARIKQFELLNKELDELRRKARDGKRPWLEAMFVPPTNLTTPTRIVPIPYHCVVADLIDEKDVRVLLSVSRDEGRTWTLVKEGRPGKGQLDSEAPEDGLYLLKLEVEVVLNKGTRQLLDPTRGDPSTATIKVRVKADTLLDPGELQMLRAPIELKVGI